MPSHTTGDDARTPAPWHARNNAGAHGAQPCTYTGTDEFLRTRAGHMIAVREMRRLSIIVVRNAHRSQSPPRPGSYRRMAARGARRHTQL